MTEPFFGLSRIGSNRESKIRVHVFRTCNSNTLSRVHVETGASLVQERIVQSSKFHSACCTVPNLLNSWSFTLAAGWPSGAARGATASGVAAARRHLQPAPLRRRASHSDSHSQFRKDQIRVPTHMANLKMSKAVLRIRIRDPGAFLTPGFGIRVPGWVKSQDPDQGSGSRMNNPDNITSSLETTFWVKNLRCRSGIRDGKIRIRDGKIRIPDRG